MVSTDTPSYWNSYALGPMGYDADAERRSYVAPEKTADLVRPYLKEGDLILDAGCGTGKLAEHLTGFAMDGVDFSSGMLAMAQGYRRLLLADLTTPYIAEAKYDALVSAGVYGDFIPASSLPNTLRHLKERAVVAISGRERMLENVDRILEMAGFDIVHRELAFAHYDFMNLIPIDYLYIIAVRESS